MNKTLIESTTSQSDLCKESLGQVWQYNTFKHPEDKLLKGTVRKSGKMLLMLDLSSQSNDTPTLHAPKARGWYAGIVYGSVWDALYVSHLQRQDCVWTSELVWSTLTERTARELWGEICWISFHRQWVVISDFWILLQTDYLTCKLPPQYCIVFSAIHFWRGVTFKQLLTLCFMKATTSASEYYVFGLL